MNATVAASTDGSCGLTIAIQPVAEVVKTFDVPPRQTKLLTSSATPKRSALLQDGSLSVVGRLRLDVRFAYARGTFIRRIDLGAVIGASFDFLCGNDDKHPDDQQ